MAAPMQPMQMMQPMPAAPQQSASVVRVPVPVPMSMPFPMPNMMANFDPSKVAVPKGFKLEHHELTLSGLCESCA